jgi:hypothetical protein
VLASVALSCSLSRLYLLPSPLRNCNLLSLLIIPAPTGNSFAPNPKAIPPVTAPVPDACEFLGRFVEFRSGRSFI